MSECFHYIFLKNEKAKPAKDFNDKIFLRGISLYEVIRVVSGRALFLETHFQRLTNSAACLEQNLWLNLHQIKESISNLIALNDSQNGNIKLVFHIDGENKTFLAYFIQHYYPNEDQYKNGVRTLVHQADRPKPNAKVYNHSLRSTTNDLIKEAEIFEVLLLNSMGNITEGSRSNLFFIKNNELHTALDTDVLHGIIRSKVIEAAEELKIPIQKHSIQYDDLPSFEAAFLTGTSLQILPIKRINSISYSSSHEIIGRLSEVLRTKISEYLK
ncbi:hypothetical protein BZG01_17265 [Labilibaculum manganireducens]|uniref:branched-chain-amino-acid transaminase n=1 Tax=Labilibaculum manganireducens TaxID=1940525 RepID=A0A2N3HX57_9BACT|nr:aminotransferase class IV [Labilibaculum manganireducens]PKQ62639.1 hypothetical protein BZG01_17265 [Labilibaculum manganireducens]